MSERTEDIIKTHVTFSMIAGALPFPVIDIAAVTAIQLDMLKKLAQEYDVDFDSEKGKSLLTALISSTVGTVIGRSAASLVKVIPVIGTVLGIGSQAILSGATTYAVGNVFDNHFKLKGTLSGFRVDAFAGAFKDFFEKGKNFAEGLWKKSDEEDVLSTIEKLRDLKERGILSEEEFEKTKEQLLAKLQKN